MFMILEPYRVVGSPATRVRGSRKLKFVYPQSVRMWQAFQTAERGSKGHRSD